MKAMKKMRILSAMSAMVAVARGKTTWDRQGIDWMLKPSKQRKRAHCVNSGVKAAKRSKAKRMNVAARKRK